MASAVAEEARPAAYERAVDLAFKEFELGNYVEARARFLEANALLPNARSLRALGIVEYELRNYVRSVEYLEQALLDSRRPLSAEERAESEQMIGQARGYVARYTIRTQPADAALLLDQAPLALGSHQSVLLAVGEHVLEASAPGYLSTRRHVHVLGPGDVTLNIQLEARATDAEAETKPLRKKWWLWASVGAAVVAGVVVGVVAARRPAEDEKVLGGTTGIVVRVPRPE